MSRKPLIAGNWKMHKTAAEAEAFLAEPMSERRPFEAIEPR